ncbi:MAG: chromosome segregation protein SMC [Cyanobacteria bacterium P01_H01_bin.74]
MHIHQIVIDNFKSFSGKTVIPFEPGFTTVSGPNGSGKSNIIDSILFCLGLSTSRTMRAEKISDLVNNLSNRKEASVAITFKKDAEDLKTDALQTRLNLSAEETQAEKQPENQTNADTETTESTQRLVEDNAAPVEITRDQLGPNSQFVQVSRRIRAGSQTFHSTYTLNGATTTLTDIHDYLSQYNISPGTYNVMMQGDVAGIVNMSAPERRKIVDEIAGVAEFDRKIEQANTELQATATNIERNAILLAEIDVRLSQLAGERDHALKYQALKAERATFETQLLAAEYKTLTTAMATTTENITRLREEKKHAGVLLETVVQAISETHTTLLDLTASVKRKGEDQQIALKKQIEELKGHVARKQDFIASGVEKKTAAENRIVQLHQEIERMQANAAEIDTTIAGFNHQLDELNTLHEGEESVLKRLETQLDGITASSDTLTVKRSEASKTLLDEETTLARLQRETLDLEAALNRIDYDVSQRQKNLAAGNTKQTMLQQRQQNLETEKKDLTEQKEAADAQARLLQSQVSEAHNKLAQQQQKLQQFQKDYVVLEARQRAYDEVNFTRAVDTILKSGLSGVHGTIAQLADVDPGYRMALEIALGGRIQNIVVDDEHVASQGIRLLQENRAGRATFLPLTKIISARKLARAPMDAGVIDFAFNLIDFDARYSDVFAYALGETLIVDCAETAKQMIRRYRMVTLDGSLYEKSGAMTGGSQTQRSRGNAFGGAQLDNDLVELAKRRDYAAEEKSRVEQHVSGLQIKLETVKADLDKINQRYSAVSAALNEVLEQLRTLDAEAEPEDWGQLTSEKASLEVALTESQAACKAQEKTLETARQALAEIEIQLPQDQLEDLRSQMKEVRFQMAYYDTHIRNVQGDIKSKSLEKQYQEAGQADCKLRIEETQASIVHVEKDSRAAQEEIELTKVQIDALTAQTYALDDELKKLQDERDGVQAQLIEQEKQKNKAERQIGLIDEQIQAGYARQRELQPQIEKAKQALKAAGIDGSTIAEMALPNQAEIESSITTMTQKMQQMEPVNMLAIDDYDKVSERRAALSEKIDTLNAEQDAIRLKIASYHDLKLLSFQKAFDNIDQNFKTIFAELSDGEGQLMLTNPSAPFEGGLTIHAQPRGKKMLRIEGLSGGEKSLTSLAFVFAIQRYMPAPFYALDEVDQNLDGINAERLAAMVGREAGRAQFVVVSLRKPMIEQSERTIGVTQRQNGKTKVTGIKHRAFGEDAASDKISHQTVSSQRSLVS